MNEEELKCLNEQYWEEKRLWSKEKYVRKLLCKEIEYIKEKDNIEVKSCDVLIQLIGFSWEPLLKSLCFYKPKKLVLVLNKYYGTEVQGWEKKSEYEEYMEILKVNNLIDKKPEVLPESIRDNLIEEDRPSTVFKFLKEQVFSLYNNYSEDVVIDITGAKKSMIAGAYLFASFTNIDVSYVNYPNDGYSKKYEKPYGYKNKFDEFNNPLKAFKLNDWEKVRQNYEKYAFRQAYDLIEDIENNTEEYLTDNDLCSINKLKKWLIFYELWDNGDFRGCVNILNESEIKNYKGKIPTVVEQLGDKWPQKEKYGWMKKGIEKLAGKGLNIEESFFLKTEDFFVYIKDEFYKIRRLIDYNEDFRSALLRAAGLNEILLKTRIIRSWKNNLLLISKNKKDDFISRTKLLEQEDYQEINNKQINNALFELPGGSKMIDILRNKKSKHLNYTDFSIKLREDCPAMKQFETSKNECNVQNLKNIFDLRNMAIHFCLSVSRKMAEAAWEMAEENIEDFKNNWLDEEIDLTNIEVEKIEWDELCEICEVDFLPTKREG